jgi:hypothetical protein
MSTSGRKQMQVGTGATSDSHPIPVGTQVTVLRMSQAGASIEGRAVVKDIARGRNFYRVQFCCDPAVRQRIVHPEYQNNPDRMLEILRDLWRTSSTPAVADFFPPDENM